jgi:hypothetical protein
MSSRQLRARRKIESWPVLSVEEQIELRMFKSHHRGLDNIANLINLSSQKDPTYRFTPSTRRQIQAKFRELASAGFSTAECEVDELPNDVLIQIHTLLSSIQVKIDPLEARAALSEAANLPLNVHSERVRKFKEIARSHGKIETAVKEILHVSRSTWYLYERRQFSGKRRLAGETKAELDKIIDELKSPR